MSRDEALTDAKGLLALGVGRNGSRRDLSLSLEISAFLEGQEAVFWLKRLGPVKDERLVQQHRLVETDLGGFYFYGHDVLENLAFVAYRREQALWRFVAVADISAKRIEIDLDVAVVPSIAWRCG